MSASKPGIAAVPSWRAAAGPGAMGPAPKPQPRGVPGRKPIEPVTYTQPNGADVFPAGKWLRSLLGSLHKT